MKLENLQLQSSNILYDNESQRIRNKMQSIKVKQRYFLIFFIILWFFGSISISLINPTSINFEIILIWSIFIWFIIIFGILGYKQILYKFVITEKGVFFKSKNLMIPKKEIITVYLNPELSFILMLYYNKGKNSIITIDKKFIADINQFENVLRKMNIIINGIDTFNYSEARRKFR